MMGTSRQILKCKIWFQMMSLRIHLVPHRQQDVPYHETTHSLHMLLVYKQDALWENCKRNISFSLSRSKLFHLECPFIFNPNEENIKKKNYNEAADFSQAYQKPYSV